MSPDDGSTGSASPASTSHPPADAHEDAALLQPREPSPPLPLPLLPPAPAPVTFQRWTLLLAAVAALLFFYVAHSSSYVPLEDGGRGGALDKSGAHHAAAPRPTPAQAAPAAGSSGSPGSASAPLPLRQEGLPQKPSSPALLPGVEVVCDLVDGAWARAAALPLQWEPVHGDAIAEAFAAGGSAAGLRALLRHASWRTLVGSDAARRQYAHLEGMRSAERRAPAPAPPPPAQQQYPPLTFLSGTSPAAYAWPFSQVLPLPSMLTVGVPGATLAAAAAAAGTAALGAAAEPSLRSALLAALAREGSSDQPLHAVFNFSQAGGAHAYDSLLHAPTTTPARLLPRLAPYVQFTLTPASSAHLTRMELELVQAAMVRTCAALVGAIGSGAREALAMDLGAERDAGCDVGGSGVGAGDAFHGAAGMLEEWKRVQGEIRLEAGEKWVSQEAAGSGASGGAGKGGAGGLRGLRAAAAAAAADADAAAAMAGAGSDGNGADELGEEEEVTATSAFTHHPLVLLEEVRLHIAPGGDARGKGTGSSSFTHALPFLGASEAYALTLEGIEAPGFLGPSAASGAAGSSGALAEVLSVTPWGALQGLEAVSQVLESWEVQAQHGRGVAGSLAALQQVLSTHIPEKCMASSRGAGSSGGSSGSGSGSEAQGFLFPPEAGGGATPPQPAPQQPHKRQPQPLALPRATTPPVTLPLYILDQPWKPWRGQLLDTARHFMPIPDLLALLDGMAAARLNVLHWHLCDAQSMPLQLPSLPELAAKGAWHEDAVYSPTDVRTVVAHAAALGIRVVPEVDMPAHTRALGRSHPELLAPCGAASTGENLKQMDKAALDPTLEATYTLLGRLIKDVAAMFPDAYFHFGADEVVAECWEGNAAIQAWAVAHLGALLPRGREASAGDVHAALLAYFVSRVGGLLEGVGKLPVTWEDSFVVVDGAAVRQKGGGGRGRGLKVESWEKAGAKQPSIAPPAPPPAAASASPTPTIKRGKPSSKSATRTPTHAAPSSSAAAAAAAAAAAVAVEDSSEGDLMDDEVHAAGAAGGGGTGSDSASRSNTRTPSRSHTRTRTPSGTPAAAAAAAVAVDDDLPLEAEAAVSAPPPSASSMPAAPALAASGRGSRSLRPTARSPTASVTPPIQGNEPLAQEEPSDDAQEELLAPSQLPPAAPPAASATRTRTRAPAPPPLEDDSGTTASHTAPSTPTPTPTSTPTSTPTPSSTRSRSSTPTPTSTHKPPATPAPHAPPSLALAYPPQAIIQGWKCWESHADGALAAATAAQHAVLQSSCWYLDWSSTWADFAQHWPLPEHGGGGMLPSPSPPALTAQQQPPLMPYPPFAFTRAAAYLGGEAAMWSERVDASNLACRVWPRAAVTGEVGWSHTLAYARSAGDYAAGARPALPQPALAAVGIRLLSHTRRMARRGLHTASLSIFAPARAPGAAAAAAALNLALPPALTMEEDFIAFNGMCPGIAQGMQRTPQALSTLRALSGTATAAAAAAAPARGLKFVAWNVHDGAQTLDRQTALFSWLKSTDAHVVGVVEAMNWQSALSTSWVATLEGRQRRLAEAAGGSAGEEEEEVLLVGPARHRVVRALGNSSSVPPPPQPPPSRSGAQGTIPSSLQSAGFQRRAALAGYPYSHLVVTTSGFHLALLSVLPLTVVLEDTGSAAFERGLLVGDAGGVRFVVAHLHAQDAAARLEEAARIRALVTAYSAAGLAVVVLGDFNTLSPADAACLEAEGALAGLLAPGAPPHLRTKYTCKPATSPGCLESFAHATGGFSGANSDPAQPLLDYRPMQLLLSSGDEAGLALSDLYAASPATGAAEAAAAACPASYPTAFLASRAGVDVDGHDDNAHVPLRLDYALGNGALLAAFPGLSCTLGGFHFSQDGHVLDAVSGRRLSPPAAAAAFAAMLKASDHLPVVCQQA